MRADGTGQARLTNDLALTRSPVVAGLIGFGMASGGHCIGDGPALP